MKFVKLLEILEEVNKNLLKDTSSKEKQVSNETVEIMRKGLIEFIGELNEAEVVDIFSFILEYQEVQEEIDDEDET